MISEKRRKRTYVESHYLRSDTRHDRIGPHGTDMLRRLTMPMRANTGAPTTRKSRHCATRNSIRRISPRSGGVAVSSLPGSPISTSRFPLPSSVPSFLNASVLAAKTRSKRPGPWSIRSSGLILRLTPQVPCLLQPRTPEVDKVIGFPK